MWCGEDDPLGSRVHLEQVANTGASELASLLAAWEEAQTRLRLPGMTAKRALEQAEFDTALFEVIYSAPCRPSPRSLGRYLASVRDRVVDGRRFVPADDGHGTQVWCVVRVGDSTPEVEPVEEADVPPELDDHGIDHDAILATLEDD